MWSQELKMKRYLVWTARRPLSSGLPLESPNFRFGNSQWSLTLKYHRFGEYELNLVCKSESQGEKVFGACVYFIDSSSKNFNFACTLDTSSCTRVVHPPFDWSDKFKLLCIDYFEYSENGK